MTIKRYAFLLLFLLAGVSSNLYSKDLEEHAKSQVVSGEDVAIMEHESVDNDVIEEVVVTGSRIGRFDSTSSVPITSISELDLTLSGTANLENLVNTLPQFVGGQTSRSNNPGTGATQINLRGLGFNRNLVLVNGRRFMFFSEDQVTDINTIPAALVKRIEVVTGGSSAVYGSDAIAGVTNFILRNDFEGVEVQAKFGGDTAGDAVTQDLTFTMGGNFANDRGNAIVSINYYERDPILQGDRSFSEFALGDGFDENGNPALIPRGSTKTPNGGFANIPFGDSLLLPGFEGLNNALAAAGLSNIGRRGFTFDNSNSTPRVFIDPEDRYNFAPLNYLQTPLERSSLMAMSNFKLKDNIEIYTEASFSQNVVDHQLAESNISFIFPINIDNPYVSPEIQEVFRQVDLLEQGDAANDGIANIRISRRFSEVGPRQALSTRNAWRAGGGIRGELEDFSDNYFKNISFDSYYFFSRTNSVLNLNNTISFNILSNGLLSNAPGVTPLINPFGAGNISTAAADALRVNTANTSLSQLKVAVASLTGDVVELDAGIVKASVGVEWRSAKASSTPDHALSTGDVVGFEGFQPTFGEINVKEIFGEMRIPLLSNVPFARNLTANTGFRYSDYDVKNVGAVWSYLAGLEWSPGSDVRLRGQFQSALRAPNIGELFGGQSGSSPRATDPCAVPSAATNPGVRDTCIASGVPATDVGNPDLQPNDRINAVLGGNPNLTAEDSDTVTFGIMYTPESLAGLSISLDYYEIEVVDAISTLAGGVGNILDLCYNVIQDVNSTVCQAINRDPVDGVISSPFSVQALNENIGAIKVSGIDAKLNYNFDVEWGLLSDSSVIDFDFAGTWTNEFSVTPVQDLPSEVNHCEGAFGSSCGEAKPEFKSSIRLTLETGPLSISLRHRYLSEVTDDKILIPRRLGRDGPSEADFAAPILDAQGYIDLSFVYNSENGDFTINGGINNITDNSPPITGRSQQQANTYPSTYDALGAEFFVGFTTKF